MGVVIGYPNRIGVATLSAGSWEASLPLNNLKLKPLAQVARSTDALAASTKFIADYAAAKNFRVIALVNHNLSAAATWRVKLGTSSGGDEVYDSGAVNAWQLTFTADSPWESSNWWTSSAEDEFIRTPYAAIIVLPTTESARYLSVDIVDTANVDGYVQIGRVFTGPGFEADKDVENKNPCAWIDLSTGTRTESGAFWGTARRAYRTADMIWPMLTHDEGASIHELIRQARTVNEVFYAPFQDDEALNQRYGFLGKLRQMSAIEFPFAGYNSAPLMVEELL